MYFRVVHNAWTTCKRFAEHLIQYFFRATGFNACAIVLLADGLKSPSYMREFPSGKNWSQGKENTHFTRKK